jgi:hypothetical protein
VRELEGEMWPKIVEKIRSITLIKDALRRSRNLKTIERASQAMGQIEGATGLGEAEVEEETV